MAGSVGLVLRVVFSPQTHGHDVTFCTGGVSATIGPKNAHITVGKGGLLAMEQEDWPLAEGVENESPLHAALMYYRARVLRRLAVFAGARDTLTKALRRKKRLSGGVAPLTVNQPDSPLLLKTPVRWTG